MQCREGIGEKKNSGGRNFAICHSKETSNAYLPTFPPYLYSRMNRAVPKGLPRVLPFVVEGSGAVNNRWSTRL